MNVRLGFWVALVIALLVPLTAWGQQRQMPIPPHVRECLGEMSVYQGFLTQRLAGLSVEESLLSLDFSMRLLAFNVEKSGMPPTMPLPEVQARAFVKLHEIYALEDLSKEFVQEWANAKMQACVDAAESDIRPPENNRMIPKKSA